MTQLDLFKQAARKPGQVVAFPVDRRAIMVRATAHELGAFDYIAGRKFWNEHVKGLRASFAPSASLAVKSILKSAGIPQP